MSENVAVPQCPKEDPSALGNLLQAYCGVTPEQITEALGLQQRNPDLRLGDAIVILGYADAARVADLLDKQDGIRKGTAPSRDLGRLADWVSDKLLGR